MRDLHRQVELVALYILVGWASLARSMGAETRRSRYEAVSFEHLVPAYQGHEKGLYSEVFRPFCTLHPIKTILKEVLEVLLEVLEVVLEVLEVVLGVHVLKCS